MRITLGLLCVLVFGWASVEPAATAEQEPYTVTSHWITVDGAKLEGKLYLPAGVGPFPAIVTVGGSGFEDTTDDAYTHLFAETWAPAGIAVFAFSKRGAGKSTGTYSDVDFDQSASDVRTVSDYVHGLAHIDTRHIGLWGISQAGWVVPKAITAQTAFAVLVSPGGVNPAQQVEFYMTNEFRKMGLSGSDLALASRAFDTALVYYGTGYGHDEAQAAVDAIKAKPWFGKVTHHMFWHDMAAPDRLYAPQELQAQIAKRPADFTFYRAPTSFADFSPDYAAMHLPVLIIYGGKDELVPVKQSEAVIRSALRTPDVTFRTFPEGGHDIQVSPNALAEGYRELIRDWVLAHCRN